MTESTDRRAAERFAVNHDTACTFFSPVVEDFPPVRVVNISMDGIGLLVGRTIKPGTLLTVTLANQARGLTKTVLVRAIHATPQPGGCMVGGQFTTPLTYQELTALVM
jgi:hypothetical protein